MKDIKVSIITPSYNQEEFIERTILSVLNQTYPHIEYIVVDGKSTDNSIDIIRKYSDSIDCIIHEKDSGQSNAINKGFKIATGEIVGWINSDDILYPTCVEEIVKLYKLNPIGAAYFFKNINIIDNYENIIGTCKCNLSDRNYLLKNNYDVCQPGSFYSNNFLKQINYINEDLNFCMDLDLWLRLLEVGNAYSIEDKNLAAIRYGDHTKTSNFKIPFIKEIRKTLLKNGAKLIDSSVIKTYKEEVKFKIKDLI